MATIQTDDGPCTYGSILVVCAPLPPSGQGGERGLVVKPSLAYIRSVTSHLNMLIS